MSAWKIKCVVGVPPARSVCTRADFQPAPGLAAAFVTSAPLSALLSSPCALPTGTLSVSTPAYPPLQPPTSHPSVSWNDSKNEAIQMTRLWYLLIGRTDFCTQSTSRRTSEGCSTKSRQFRVEHVPRTTFRKHYLLFPVLLQQLCCLFLSAHVRLRVSSGQPDDKRTWITITVQSLLITRV